MSDQYSFITKWQIKAGMHEVWDAIYNSLEWPQWWKGVVNVKEIQQNDANGINGIREYTWGSVLPYKLIFKMKLTERNELKHLKGLAFGELEGTGEWFFEEKNNVIFIQYNWNIITNKSWMNSFSFILKPLFKFNHNVVMKWGAKGLAKKVKGKLISC